jgi:hypothetical protein
VDVIWILTPIFVCYKIDYDFADFREGLIGISTGGFGLKKLVVVSLTRNLLGFDEILVHVSCQWNVGCGYVHEKFRSLGGIEGPPPNMEALRSGSLPETLGCGSQIEDRI